MRSVVGLCCALGVACNSDANANANANATTSANPSPSAAQTAAAPLSVAAASVAAPHPWPHDRRAQTLEARLPAPSGFARVAIAPRSFAAFLRTLPLLPAGSEVRSYRDETILSANDPRLAAVVDIDVGSANLQQCADSVIRMHAEWRRFVGRGDVAYRASSGFPLNYARYRGGDRLVFRGRDLAWEHRAAASDSRETFRSYLDQVFTYANTVSLARDAKAPARTEIQAGDFFVLGGSPGHAVLVLDVARDASNRTRALLGQGFMPAQNFHVLRDEAAKTAWFSLDEESIATPFWPTPFPWSSLRRLDEG